MMAATAALEGAGSSSKEELNMPSVVQPRRGASAGTTLLHDSALRTATNKAATSSPASVGASLHSSISTPTGTKLAVTTPSESPAEGEGIKIVIDEEKEIALNQLEELEVAIKVRKVTKVDGRKIRWIEYRARKQAEEANKTPVNTKRNARWSKYKEVENSENDANVVNNNNNNNNNNNSKSESTMKVDMASTPLSVVGTNNVLESMKQQFLQGTENVDEPLANGTTQKRKSGRTRRSVSTPEGVNSNSSSPQKLSPSETKGTNLRSAIEVKNNSSGNGSLIDTTQSMPNTPATPFTSTPALTASIEKKFFYPKSLTKGLREVRKIENGTDGEVTVKAEDVKTPASSPISSLSLGEHIPALPEEKSETKTTCPLVTAAAKLILPSARSRSADNTLAKNKKIGAQKGSFKKAAAKAGGRSESEPRSIMNGHAEILLNGSAEEKSSSPAEGSSVSEPSTPNRNKMNKESSPDNVLEPDSLSRRPRGRPPRRVSLITKANSTTSSVKSSKKLKTVVADVHNTMNGEPQTVIPVSRPVLRGKRVSPTKKSQKVAASVLQGDTDDLSTKGLSPLKQPKTHEEFKSKADKNQSDLQLILPVHSSKKRKYVASKTDSESDQGEKEGKENSSASMCNQTPIPPDKTQSTKLVKGIQKPSHQEVPSLPEPENPTAISLSLIADKEPKYSKRGPRLKVVKAKIKKTNVTTAKTAAGKKITSAGGNKKGKGGQAQKSNNVQKHISPKKGKALPKVIIVDKEVSAEKVNPSPKVITEDTLLQVGSTLPKMNSSEKDESSLANIISPTSDSSKKTISQKENILNLSNSTDKDVSPQKNSTKSKPVENGMPRMDIKVLSEINSTKKDISLQESNNLSQCNSGKNILDKSGGSVETDCIDKDNCVLDSNNVVEGKLKEEDTSTKEVSFLSGAKSIEDPSIGEGNSPREDSSIREHRSLPGAKSSNDDVCIMEGKSLPGSKSTEEDTSIREGNLPTYEGSVREHRSVLSADSVVVSKGDYNSLLGAKSTEDASIREEDNSLPGAKSTENIYKREGNSLPVAKTTESTSKGEGNTLPVAKSKEDASIREGKYLPGAKSTKGTYKREGNLPTDAVVRERKSLPGAKSTEEAASKMEGSLPTQDTSIKKYKSQPREKSTENASKIKDNYLSAATSTDVSVREGNALVGAKSTEETSTWTTNLSTEDTSVRDHKSLLRVKSTENASKMEDNSLLVAESNDDTSVRKDKFLPVAKCTGDDTPVQMNNTLASLESIEKDVSLQENSTIPEVEPLKKDVPVQESSILIKSKFVDKDTSQNNNCQTKVESIGGLSLQISSIAPKVMSSEKNASIKETSPSSKENFINEKPPVLENIVLPKICLVEKGKPVQNVNSTNNNDPLQKGINALKENKASRGIQEVKDSKLQKVIVALSRNQLKNDKTHKNQPLQRDISFTKANPDKIENQNAPHVQQACPNPREYQAQVAGQAENHTPSLEKNLDKNLSQVQKDRTLQKNSPVQRGSLPENDGLLFKGGLPLRGNSSNDRGSVSKGITAQKNNPTNKGPAQKDNPMAKIASAYSQVCPPLKCEVQRSMYVKDIMKTNIISPSNRPNEKQVKEVELITEVPNSCISEQKIAKDCITGKGPASQEIVIVKDTSKLEREVEPNQETEVEVNHIAKVEIPPKNNGEQKSELQVTSQTQKGKGKKQAPTGIYQRVSGQSITEVKECRIVASRCGESSQSQQHTHVPAKIYNNEVKSNKDNSNHNVTKDLKTSQALNASTSSAVNQVKEKNKLVQNETSILEEKAAAGPSSTTSEVPPSLTAKSKEKLPRILKQLFQDEGVQNMLKSMGEDTSVAPETSPNNDPGTHKLRPKRTTEPMLSSSPELDALEAFFACGSKRKKRGTELDTLYMDEGVLNLLTSLETHSRRSHLDDASSDTSQASSSRSVKGNKFGKSSLEVSSESRKRKLSGASIVSNTSNRAMQPPDIKRPCLESQNPSADPYALDAAEEFQERIISGEPISSEMDVNLMKKKGRPSLPLSVRQKNKAIRIQLKLQKQKQMKGMASDFTQLKEDDNMNLAELKEVLRKAKETFNETPLTGTAIEKVSDKSVPPLKIKLASESVTIKSVTRPSPVQHRPTAAGLDIGKQQRLPPRQTVSDIPSRPVPRLTTALPESRVSAPDSRVSAPESRVSAPGSISAPESRVSAPESRVTAPVSRVSMPDSRVSASESRVSAPESRVSARSTMEKHRSYPERRTPPPQFTRLDNMSSNPPSLTSFTSLIRNFEGNGNQRSRQRYGGESVRQSQRASVRQSEGNYHYRDISLRKFNNFMQIILSPSTTKMKNALNSRVLRELCEALNILKRDDSVRIVLLTATGSTFCQGVDLTALQHPNIETRKKNAENLVRGIKDFLKALVQFPKPIVAGVNGNAMGLGVTMLPLFDMVIANDKAEFYLPYAKLGQVPEGGATYTFPNLFGKLQSTKLFLGHKLTASKAQEMGLASESIWPATYQQELIPKVALLATQSAQSMEATKALMNHHLVTKLELSLESECRLLLQQWTSPHFNHLCKRFLDTHHIHLQKPVNLPL
ncbi:uncharacterized protein [Procambarus clarkii]|uniref:uncharacterized protein isoform X1 n=2 Tax=Procambarus clarkii TaxID=6728 RepID=UPI0037427EB7